MVLTLVSLSTIIDVATDPGSLASAVVVFYTTTAAAFPFFPLADTITLAQIFGIIPKRHDFQHDSPCGRGDRDERDSVYTVVVDAPDIGVKV
ncbi:hypothetical protein FB451DRAFT_1272641, partial [Mycena latifolia]